MITEAFLYLIMLAAAPTSFPSDDTYLESTAINFRAGTGDATRETFDSTITLTARPLTTRLNQGS